MYSSWQPRRGRIARFSLSECKNYRPSVARTLTLGKNVEGYSFVEIGVERKFLWLRVSPVHWTVKCTDLWSRSSLEFTTSKKEMSQTPPSSLLFTVSDHGRVGWGEGDPGGSVVRTWEFTLPPSLFFTSKQVWFWRSLDVDPTGWSLWNKYTGSSSV